RIPTLAECPRRGDVLFAWRAFGGAQIVGEPREVAALAMRVGVVVTLTPEPRIGSRRRINGLVGHLRRERHVDEVELRVAVIAAEREIRHAVESRIAD